VQPAQAFTEGYFPPESAGRVPVAEVQAGSALEAASNDHVAVGGCFAPDEQVAEQLFGGNGGALGELYTPQLQRLSGRLGCCSAEACGASRDPNHALCSISCNICLAVPGHYGLGANCSLDELPLAYFRETPTRTVLIRGPTQQVPGTHTS